MKRIFAFILSLIFSSGIAFSQAAPNAATSIRISLYVRGAEDAFGNLSYLQAGKAIPLVIQPGRRSRPFIYSSGPEFVVVRDVRDATGKVQRHELGRVTLPGGSKDVLLLGAIRNGQLSLMPVPLDTGTFPDGSLRVLNYSGIKVAVRFGKVSRPLDNGGSTQFGPFPASEVGQECSFAAPIGEGGSWKIFNSRGVAFTGQVRYLFVVGIPTVAGGEPEIVVIRDVVPKAR